MVKKVLALAFSVLLVFSALTGCSGNKTNGQKSGDTTSGSSSGKLAVVGSTSVSPLMEELKTAYAAKNPGVNIEIQSVGSTAGIQATADGSADIGMSSRDLTDAEKAQGIKPTAIAMDGIAVIVNPKNGVANLTSDQIRKIFMGEITNWKEVGGADKPIVVVSREDGSGTRSAFEELLKVQKEVQKDGKATKISGLAANALVAEGNGAIKSNIASKEDAIGYLSLGYLDNTVKAVKVNGVEATVKNILGGTYKISRPFLVLTKGEPSGPAKNFIDFMLSADGQKVVKDSNYIAVK